MTEDSLKKNLLRIYRHGMKGEWMDSSKVEERICREFRSLRHQIEKLKDKESVGSKKRQ